MFWRIHRGSSKLISQPSYRPAIALSSLKFPFFLTYPLILSGNLYGSEIGTGLLGLIVGLVSFFFFLGGGGGGGCAGRPRDFGGFDFYPHSTIPPPPSWKPRH